MRLLSVNTCYGRRNENVFTADSMIWTVKIEDYTVRKEILEEIRPYQKSNVAKTVDRILNTLKLMCQCDMPPVREDRIHFRNGTYHLDGSFTEDKEWTMNRLPVRYNPDAPAPERWLSFLDDLLEKEDIPVLQEFMGYAMIPSNRGQKMLLMIGKGGEGKSRSGGCCVRFWVTT